jgi:hypothetical protein
MDPVGPENDHHIYNVAMDSAIVICAWGNDGGHRGRSGEVLRLLGLVGLKALKINASTGEPAHPLYLSYDLKPIPLNQAI